MVPIPRVVWQSVRPTDTTWREGKLILDIYSRRKSFSVASLAAKKDRWRVLLKHVRIERATENFS